MPVGAVVARNLMDGVTVLSSDIKGTHQVEWAALGDPDGNDVQYIPNEVAECVNFRRAISRQVIEIIAEESDPAVTDAILLQVEAFKRRQNTAHASSADVIDRPVDRDALMMFCVGPDTRGNNGKCGQPVNVASAKKNDAPPLCPSHRPLSPQFVPESGQSNGEPVTIWTRVTMGSRESM